MTEFLPVQAILDFTATFENPTFGLWRDPNAIAATAYRALSPFGLRLTGLQWDWGQSIGENRLQVLGLFDYRASFEIRRDGIRIQFFELPRDRVVELSQSAEELLVAFQTGEPDISYGRFDFTLGSHGKLSAGNTTAFLRDFSSKAPRGLGEVREFGCAFWFADTDECSGLSLLIEPSRRFPEALWLRLQGSIDARKVPLKATRQRLEDLYARALSSLDLTPPAEVKEP